MKLNDLIKKLQSKKTPAIDVNFLVYDKVTGDIVCIELDGPATKDIMRAMAKHAPERPKETK